MSHRSGRHFLQIPADQRADRVLRAMDMPTMDHRGPSSACSAARSGGLKEVFQTKQR